LKDTIAELSKNLDEKEKNTIINEKSFESLQYNFKLQFDNLHNLLLQEQKITNQYQKTIEDLKINELKNQNIIFKAKDETRISLFNLHKTKIEYNAVIKINKELLNSMEKIKLQFTAEKILHSKNLNTLMHNEDVIDNYNRSKHIELSQIEEKFVHQINTMGIQIENCKMGVEDI